MANYKSMYYKIFNKVSDVIIELQKIQLQTEAMYADSDEPEICLPEQIKNKQQQNQDNK